MLALYCRVWKNHLIALSDRQIGFCRLAGRACILCRHCYFEWIEEDSDV